MYFCSSHQPWLHFTHQFIIIKIKAACEAAWQSGCLLAKMKWGHINKYLTLSSSRLSTIKLLFWTSSSNSDSNSRSLFRSSDDFTSSVDYIKRKKTFKFWRVLQAPNFPAWKKVFLQPDLQGGREWISSLFMSGSIWRQMGLWVYARSLILLLHPSHCYII